MWDKKFQFVLTANESEEMHEEWDTENFIAPFQELIISDVDSVEGAISEFKQRCTFSNGDWDWESNNEGEVGEIRTGNDLDGLSVIFDFKLIK